MASVTSFSLPSPSETPYRTPSSSRSRRSREYEDMSPSATPPPIASDVRVAKRRSRDSENGLSPDAISPLDPRRFTPNLHASLVSEILSLRRDLEGKSKDIDQLEQRLHTSQVQNESLNKNLLASNKEVRSAKRQMQLLEGGTLSALSDLSKERDEAINDVAELRSRLEHTQKRAKVHEENTERVQSMWESDKESWAVDKRALENKVHVIEGRLRIVLAEVTRSQPEESQSSLTRSLSRTSSVDEIAVKQQFSPTHRSDSRTQRRRQSSVSVSSDRVGGRASILSFTGADATNLADELAFDDIEEESGFEFDDSRSRFSDDAATEATERPASSLSNKSRAETEPSIDLAGSEHGVPQKSDPSHSEKASNRSSKPELHTNYVDSGVQFSPPASPIRASLVDSRIYADSTPVKRLTSFGTSEASSQAGNESWTVSHSPMVSSSCQTIEYLPSPPLTPNPQDISSTIIEKSVYEKARTREISTQTDIPTRSAQSYHTRHLRTETTDLGIPTIAIIPPTSRPVTPENFVALPPHTRSAGCQVESHFLSGYTSTSMQTEEIRVDKRNIFSPHLLSGSTQMANMKGKSALHPRKASSRSTPPVPSIPPMNDDGPLTKDVSGDKSRPIRSSSLFAGFDDQIEELSDDQEDDVFTDDNEDIFNRPTARFTLRSGKMISQSRPLEDIGEITAANAGEAVALENLKLSESNLPPELRQISSDDPVASHGIKRQATIKRGSSRSSSMRRTTLISNGTTAHQSQQSESTVSSRDSAMPPPIPIPLRYSSARIGKSQSEGGRNPSGSRSASPTKQIRARTRQPALRKARSGPALSPAGSTTRRQRSKSPPLNSRVSIVPEMPTFEMPKSMPPYTLADYPGIRAEGSAPRPAVATGPGRNPSHRRMDSNPGLLEQTSVVDAIAQTMVGEWMFKYVRRRKSFGKLDTKDWDPNKSVDELANNPGSTGVRHKRWVWLAPYERAIMWSSKQPMNGTALMGKSGRKLTIKSVLDVKDDNPMPKNSLTGPQFNRSILILTPQRALKFTATNLERHHVWLTALSFLSHSPLSMGDLAALPPPPEEYRPPSPPPSLGRTFTRRAIRDSIRIAKGSGRHETTSTGTLNLDKPLPIPNFFEGRPTTSDFNEPEADAALPPIIKRFHARQRSNTAPKGPPPAFRGFNTRDMPLTGTGPASNYSQSAPTTAGGGSSDRGPYSPSYANPSMPSSRRGSEASAVGRPNLSSFAYNNVGFFDSSHPSMTMRMDAFIENKQAGRGGFRNLRLGGQAQRTTETRDRDPTYWGFDNTTMSSLSPVDSLNPVNNHQRLSDSTGRGSDERGFSRGS